MRKSSFYICNLINVYIPPVIQLTWRKISILFAQPLLKKRKSVWRLRNHLTKIWKSLIDNVVSIQCVALIQCNIMILLQYQLIVIIFYCNYKDNKVLEMKMKVVIHVKQIYYFCNWFWKNKEKFGLDFKDWKRDESNDHGGVSAIK